MPKYYGRVGYVEPVEKPAGSGIYELVPQERYYFGDVVSNRKQWQAGNTLNGDLNISNSISIVADEFAYKHSAWIRYVEFMGAMWQVSSIEPQHPRLILSVGGLYNGPQTNSATCPRGFSGI